MELQGIFVTDCFRGVLVNNIKGGIDFAIICHRDESVCPLRTFPVNQEDSSWQAKCPAPHVGSLQGLSRAFANALDVRVGTVLSAKKENRTLSAAIGRIGDLIDTQKCSFSQGPAPLTGWPFSNLGGVAFQITIWVFHIARFPMRKLQKKDILKKEKNY